MLRLSRWSLSVSGPIGPEALTAPPSGPLRQLRPISRRARTLAFSGLAPLLALQPRQRHWAHAIPALKVRSFGVDDAAARLCCLMSVLVSCIHRDLYHGLPSASLKTRSLSLAFGPIFLHIGRLAWQIWTPLSCSRCSRRSRIRRSRQFRLSETCVDRTPRSYIIMRRSL